jgi:TetR/AcrR family transcriptional regulator
LPAIHPPPYGPRNEGSEGCIVADEAWGGGSPPRRIRTTTRAGEANIERILDAALEVFAAYGFRGARIDQIAAAAGLSKPNLLYYFRTKDELYTAGPAPDPRDVARSPARARREERPPRGALGLHRPQARLFPQPPHGLAALRHGDAAGRAAPGPSAHGPARRTRGGEVPHDQGWIAEGRLAPVDPKHLIFAIWATTQHYADFSSQIEAITGHSLADDAFFETTCTMLSRILIDGVLPRGAKGE